MSRKSKKEQKHRYLRRIVALCMALVTFIVLASFVTAWHAGEQLDPVTVSALVAALVSELVLSLLKRNNDTNKEAAKVETKPEIPSDETI